MATDTGAGPARMATAITYESAPGEYNTKVASGVRTSQEGVAMNLILGIRRLAYQEGVYWVVPDSEFAMGALHTYPRSNLARPTGYHKRHSHTLALVMVVNVRVDAATGEEPQADLAWMLRRPYAFLPEVKFRDHCSWPRPICKKGFTNRRPSPLRCSTSASGHPTMSEALVCR